MRCIFPLSNLKRLIHLYDSVELTTSQRPSLSIEHSFWDAIYPFMVAKKRIFRAYTSQVNQFFPCQRHNAIYFQIAGQPRQTTFHA